MAKTDDVLNLLEQVHAEVMQMRTEFNQMRAGLPNQQIAQPDPNQTTQTTQATPDPNQQQQVQQPQPLSADQNVATGQQQVQPPQPEYQQPAQPAQAPSPQPGAYDQAQQRQQGQQPA